MALVALLILHVVLVQGLVNLHQLVGKKWSLKTEHDYSYNSCSDSSQA